MKIVDQVLILKSGTQKETVDEIKYNYGDDAPP